MRDQLMHALVGSNSSKWPIRFSSSDAFSVIHLLPFLTVATCASFVTQ